MPTDTERNIKFTDDNGCDYFSLCTISFRLCAFLNIFILQLKQVSFVDYLFWFLYKKKVCVWRSSVNQKQRQHGLGPEVRYSRNVHKST